MEQRKTEEERVGIMRKTADLQQDNKPTSLLKYAHVQKAAEEMRQQIFQADLNRKESEALTEMELEARDRAQCLVERASSLRMEQEEEIRLLNKVHHKV